LEILGYTLFDSNSFAIESDLIDALYGDGSLSMNESHEALGREGYKISFIGSVTLDWIAQQQNAKVILTDRDLESWTTSWTTSRPLRTY
jgi:hypothetical protein